MYEICCVVDKNCESPLRKVKLVLSRKLPENRKALQFSAHLDIYNDGSVKLAATSAVCKHRCKLWNNSNFKRTALSLGRMFVEQALVKKACETKDTDMWHIKEVSSTKLRFTLYDCGMLFLEMNIKHYSR